MSVASQFFPLKTFLLFRALEEFLPFSRGNSAEAPVPQFCSGM
jgi:hypothetical protein